MQYPKINWVLVVSDEWNLNMSSTFLYLDHLFFEYLLSTEPSNNIYWALK